jgi:hypothetical protein
VTRRNSLLLVVVGVAALVGAYWMLALAPKRQEAASLDKQIAAKQAALNDAEAQVAEYDKARQNYRVNYEMIARLGKAVPADDDVRSLMVQVNTAADRAGVDFHKIDVGTGTGSAAPTTTGTAAPGAPAAPAATPPPGATTVGTAGFSTMPFSLNFKGSFFELGKFFNRIDRFVSVRNGGLDVTGRLLLLNSITLTPDAIKGFPTLTADVSANSYLLPPTEGLTAGATAAGPTAAAATAAPAPSATPSSSSPVTTTTATISGATR